MSKIPKILHYCWFGGRELNPLGKACKDSWLVYFSDYEFIEWNESNADLSDPIAIHAFQRKQWAFLSDYVRLINLYKYGGVYVDVDLEVIRDLSPLFEKYEFVIGEERAGHFGAGIIASVANSPIILECIHALVKNFKKTREFVEIPRLISPVLKSQLPGNVLLAPPHYFYPFNPYDPDRQTKQLLYCDIKDDTYAIHHYQKSWSFGWYDRLYKKIRNVIKTILKRT